MPWFEPHDHFGIDLENPSQKPNAGIRDLRVDQQGRLWVAVYRPDDQREEGLGNVRGLYGRTVSGASSYNDYMDTVIDVIDPATGELVASGRFDPAVYFVDGSEYAWSYWEDETGYPVVQIYRLGLSQSP